MNIQQLRYVREVAANGLSVSKAAKAMHTSQPGVSQQIRLLEEELGVTIFNRERNRLSGLTAHGKVILDRLNSALNDIDNVHAYARSLRPDNNQEITIITSHTQARYVLPQVLEAFSKMHPAVRVDVKQGNAAEIMSALSSHAHAIGIIAGEVPVTRDVLALPYSEYHRIVVVPAGHELLRHRNPSLKQIAEYPLISYEHSISARQVIIDTFTKIGLKPQVILSAIDADVIKACVERGLGIAVLPEIAFDPRRDTALRALASHALFPMSSATIVIHRKRLLRLCEYDFIQLLGPQWTRRKIEKLAATGKAASTPNF
jgi:LysR family transcriptional regulator, cys regulon transcriptional activator